MARRAPPAQTASPTRICCGSTRKSRRASSTPSSNAIWEAEGETDKKGAVKKNRLLRSLLRLNFVEMLISGVLRMIWSGLAVAVRQFFVVCFPSFVNLFPQKNNLTFPFFRFFDVASATTFFVSRMVDILRLPREADGVTFVGNNFRDGMIYCAFFFVDCVLLSLFMHHVNHQAMKSAIRMRSCLFEVLMRKSLRLRDIELHRSEVLPPGVGRLPAGVRGRHARAAHVAAACSRRLRSSSCSSA